MSPEDVKPVIKLTTGSTDMLYGASNPSAWNKVYPNLPTVDENGIAIPYTFDFSVEPGSVLTPGMNYEHMSVYFNLKGEIIMPLAIPSTEGGSQWVAYPRGDKVGGVVKIAVFEDLGKYFLLPPVRFAP